MPKEKIGLPEQFVIFDTEFTTWEGALARNWTGPGEYREIVQIGAVLVDGNTLQELDHAVIYAKPLINPVLSDYFINLTGITQETVDAEGVSYFEALHRYKSWLAGKDMYSWGEDILVMKENANLIKISFPFEIILGKTNMRPVFEKYGIDVEKYDSGTIPRAFGEEPSQPPHQGLSDSRSILQALRALRRSIR